MSDSMRIKSWHFGGVRVEPWGDGRLEVWLPNGSHFTLGHKSRGNAVGVQGALAIGHPNIKRILELVCGGNVLTEHRFQDCRSPRGNPLRFDYFIPSRNLCLEVDGWGHRAKNAQGQRLREYDRIRDEYCQRKGIRLLRIDYKDAVVRERLEAALKPLLA